MRKGRKSVSAKLPQVIENERQTYFFRSTLGRECAFFIMGDEFVFLGDHTTYTVRE